MSAGLNAAIYKNKLMTFDLWPAVLFWLFVLRIYRSPDYKILDQWTILCGFTDSLMWIRYFLKKIDRDTLRISQSEWPKHKPFLLMHSRHGRISYDPKIKRFFQIAWRIFEIILFIRFEIAWTGPDKSEIFFGIWH